MPRPRAEPVARAPPGPGRRGAADARQRGPAVRPAPPAAPRAACPTGSGRSASVPRAWSSWPALGFGALRLLGGGVRLDGVEPARVRVGQRATLTGSGFAADPAGNTVLFDDREAKVLQASPTRLEVEVPEAVAESGAERQVGVVVKKGDRTSARVRGGALPGAAAARHLARGRPAGRGGPPRRSRLGRRAPPSASATRRRRSMEVQATSIRAIVPEVAGGPGTEAPVVVTVGGVDSNPAPFVVGHLPVVSAVSPASAAAGDVVKVSGRGFQADPLRNDVRVGGVPALVLSAAEDALKVVVPRVGPGEAARAARGAGARIGAAWAWRSCRSPRPPTPSSSAFVAEPFTAIPGRPHAVLATGLGPAFVLAASGGRTAAARAVEAAGRLNAAAQALRTTVGLNLEARQLDVEPGPRPRRPAGRAPRGRPRRTRRPTTRTGRGCAAAADPSRARASRGGGRRSGATSCCSPSAASGRSSRPRSRRKGACSASSSTRRSAPAVPACRARSWTRRVRRSRDGLRLLALRVPASVTAPVAAPAAAPAALPAAAATPPAGPPAARGDVGRQPGRAGPAPVPDRRLPAAAGGASPTRAASRSPCRS